MPVVSGLNKAWLDESEKESQWIGKMFAVAFNQTQSLRTVQPVNVSALRLWWHFFFFYEPSIMPFILEKMC